MNKGILSVIFIIAFSVPAFAEDDVIYLGDQVPKSKKKYEDLKQQKNQNNTGDFLQSSYETAKSATEKYTSIFKKLKERKNKTDINSDIDALMVQTEIIFFTARTLQIACSNEPMSKYWDMSVSLAEIVAGMRLEIADFLLEKKEYLKAKEIYREIVTTFTGLRYVGLVRKAEFKLQDIRAAGY